MVACRCVFAHDNGIAPPFGARLDSPYRALARRQVRLAQLLERQRSAAELFAHGLDRLLHVDPQRRRCIARWAASAQCGGWVAAGDGMGWTCCVEQGHYGHLARKATWLYAAHVELPSLRWGASGGKARLEDGFHSAAERRAARDAGVPPAKRIPSRMLAATPPEFRDLLLSIARSST
jgi:hypothetical protein